MRHLMIDAPNSGVFRHRPIAEAGRLINLRISVVLIIRNSFRSRRALMQRSALRSVPSSSTAGVSPVTVLMDLAWFRSSGLRKYWQWQCAELLTRWPSVKSSIRWHDYWLDSSWTDTLDARTLHASNINVYSHPCEAKLRALMRSQSAVRTCNVLDSALNSQRM